MMDGSFMFMHSMMMLSLGGSNPPQTTLEIALMVGLALMMLASVTYGVYLIIKPNE